MDFKERKLTGVRLIKELEFNGRLYPIGYEFKIVGEEPVRGLNIQDHKGNIIYETIMINNYFEYIYEYHN